LYTKQGVCPENLTVPLTALAIDDPSFTITATCDGGVSNVTGLAGGTFSFNTPPIDAAVIDPNTGIITNGTSGNTYDVLYTTNGPCPASSTQSVTATLIDDPSFSMLPSCEGATIVSVATPGGTFSFNPPPGDGAVIDPVTGEITMGTAGATYTIEYTTNGPCTATTTLDVTLTLLDDPSFTMTTSCVGALIATVVTPGGTYTFNPAPGDGAVIDPLTGEVTFGTPGSTYTIQYATSGPCAASTTIDITLNNLDDPSFVLTPTCDGGYVSSVTTPGGTYTFNVTPADAAVIDGTTGDISGGTPGFTYDVLYITGGICAASTTQSVTAYSIPLAPVTSPDLQYCSSDDFANMTVSGSGGIFTWYLSPPPANAIGTGASVPPNDQNGNTTYYVTETVNNCEGEASLIVINIEDCDIIIPTAFTPDNDLANDYWEIVDLDKVYPNNIVRIYNRWGNLIYESNVGNYATDPWKGKYKGNDLPVGSYYFIIELNDKNNTKKNGTVSIIYN
jgi:gliding motility-associated-like protein